MTKDEIIKMQEIETCVKEVLEGGEVLKIKDDRTFKILWNTNNKEATTWLMSQILNRPMQDIKKVINLTNNELKPLNLYDKQKTVDFIVDLDDEIVVVELNNNNTGRDYTRNLFYTFHALLNKVERGDKYNHVHGYLINLNWFDNKYKKLQKMEGETIIEYPYPLIGEEKEKSIITVKNINLSFYDNLAYNGIKMKDFLWKLFTIDKLEDLHDVESNIDELKDYCKELERLSKDKEYCVMVWSEKLEKNLSNLAEYNDGRKDGFDEGMEEGIKTGIEQGIKTGITNAKEEIVINMYHKDIDIEMIMECTNLTKEEVEKIINSQ